jgi:hypothetical protein
MGKYRFLPASNHSQVDYFAKEGPFCGFGCVKTASAIYPQRLSVYRKRKMCRKFEEDTISIALNAAGSYT